MTEEEKVQVALFRFGVICDVVNGTRLSPGETSRLIGEKCGRKWQIPFSEKTRISKSTILRWVRLYKSGSGKLESLYPGSTQDRGRSRAMDEETCLSLMSLRRSMPEATVPHLIREMEVKQLVSQGVVLNLSTVYRFLLPGQTRQKPQYTDQGRAVPSLHRRKTADREVMP